MGRGNLGREVEKGTGEKSNKRINDWDDGDSEGRRTRKEQFFCPASIF